MMERPKNIGIKGIEVYFPKTFISQDKLEDRDIEILGEEKRQSIKGKYTKGLGQIDLAFCCDREDTVSIAMNAITQLFEKYNFTPDMFGRLEVGTESSIDRSKSIKSFLLQLFHDNPYLSGCDNTNACYGGTSAFLNSLAWIESSQWDGRMALVVCSDIAVYEDMSARPTGGCGAVAIAVGPNAPLVVEPHFATYCVHGYDFYKPNPINPHPWVDGPLTITLYYECLDECFQKYRTLPNKQLSVDDYDYICFHTPFLNHIKKCTGRLLMMKDLPNKDPLIENSRSDRALVSEWSNKAKPLFAEKVDPSCTLSKMTGNGYTASLYLAIASLIDSTELKIDQKILCFSYGSGACSTMFELRVNSDCSFMKQKLDLQKRLQSRTEKTVLEYEEAIKKENKRFVSAPYQPGDSLDLLWDHAWYLDHIDNMWRRFYLRK